MTSSESRVDSAALLVAADPSIIFEAFRSPGAEEQWLAPSGMTGRVREYDFSEGGRYRIELRHQSLDAGKTTARTDVTFGRFIALEAGRLVVQTAEFESADPAFSGEMLLTWTLEPTGEQTLVRVTAQRVPSGISAEDHVEGLNSTLRGLAQYVAG